MQLYEFNMTTYGSKPDPFRSARISFGVKDIHQSIVVTNNPSKINANQILTVRFLNLGANDVIIPGMARVAFNITLRRHSGTDANCTVVNNLGRAIVKKTSVKLEGNEVLCLDDANICLYLPVLQRLSEDRQREAEQCVLWHHVGDSRNTAKFVLVPATLRQQPSPTPRLRPISATGSPYCLISSRY